MISCRADLFHRFIESQRIAKIYYAFNFEKTSDGGLKHGKENGGIEAWCNVEIFGDVSDKKNGFVDQKLTHRVANLMKSFVDEDPLRYGPKEEGTNNMTFERFREYISSFYKPRFERIAINHKVEENFIDIGAYYSLHFKFEVFIPTE